MVRLTLQGLVLGLAAGLLACGTALADDKDNNLLDEAQKRQQIAAQALDAEIRDALATAEKLKVSDPAKATELLNVAQKKLETVTFLSIAQTATYRVTIKERIEAIANGKAKAEAAEAQKRAADLDRRITELQSQREKGAALQRDLDIVKYLRSEGKLDEAARLADEISKRNPNNVSAAQQQQVTGISGRINEAYQLPKDKAVASNAALNDVARSSIPIVGDIQYPSKEKWDKLTKDRKKYLEIPMTETERKIVEALNTVITTPTDIKDITFEKFLEDMQKQLGQTILVNKGAMKDLDISYERTFSVSLPKNITRRSLLRTALAELGLTYVVRNEIIEVMDVERAKNCMTVRTIPLGDLLYFGNPPPVQNNGNNAGKSSVDLLIEMIQDQIEPLSWQKYNGPGSITYYAPQNVLIVRNSAEVINMVGGRSR
jgi:hypothetical protein